jgi:hypothetical protein
MENVDMCAELTTRLLSVREVPLPLYAGTSRLHRRPQQPSKRQVQQKSTPACVERLPGGVI